MITNHKFVMLLIQYIPFRKARYLCLERSTYKAMTFDCGQTRTLVLIGNW